LRATSRRRGDAVRRALDRRMGYASKPPRGEKRPECDAPWQYEEPESYRRLSSGRVELVDADEHECTSEYQSGHDVRCN